MIPATFSIETEMHNSVQELCFNGQSYNDIYKYASQTVYNFFANPESFVFYEATKDIVNQLVQMIAQDEKSIRKLQVEVIEDGYYIHIHSVNVAIYSISLGICLNLSLEDLRELGEAALLHDIGQTKIDNLIINKNGKPTDDEYQEIKNHLDVGCSIMQRLGIRNIKVWQGVKQHHEKIDGSGYPLGLKGRQISLYARIICLCDIFDALTSKKNSKESIVACEAVELIKNEMKGQVDATLLEKMIEIFT